MKSSSSKTADVRQISIDYSFVAPGGSFKAPDEAAPLPAPLPASRLTRVSSLSVPNQQLARGLTVSALPPRVPSYPLASRSSDLEAAVAAAVHLDEKLPLKAAVLARNSSGSSDGDSGTPTAADCATGSGGAKQKLSAFSLALLVFSCVAGGPFGIEVAVQSIGAFATVMGLAMAGLLWGLPQALATAELAGWAPENGGQTVWVTRVLGVRYGFATGWLLMLNQVFDIALYPTLAVSYLQRFLGVSTWVQYAVKLGLLLIVTVLNIVGVDAISASATLLTALILAPFVALPITAEIKGFNFDWSAISPAAVPEAWKGQLAVAVSTLLWCQQGWGEIGALAGEIEDAAVIFPKGMAIAAGLVLIAYSVPVLFGVALSPNLANWSDGALATIADTVGTWLGVFVLISAALANMSTFITSMAAYSRTIQAVAREHLMPPLVGRVLQRNATRYQTPVPAIMLLALTTSVLMAGFDFNLLVVVDSGLFLLANCFCMVAFLRLRYTQPHAHRPYTFPGGLPLAWAATVSVVSLALFAIYTLCDGAWQVAVAILSILVVALVVGTLVERRWRAQGKLAPLAGAGDSDAIAEEEDEEDSGAADDDGEEAGLLTPVSDEQATAVRAKQHARGLLKHSPGLGPKGHGGSGGSGGSGNRSPGSGNISPEHSSVSLNSATASVVSSHSIGDPVEVSLSVAPRDSSSGTSGSSSSKAAGHFKRMGPI